MKITYQSEETDTPLEALKCLLAWVEDFDAKLMADCPEIEAGEKPSSISTDNLEIDLDSIRRTIKRHE